MIKYNLACKKCNKSFDSWFSSSKEYDKLKKLRLITCYNCGSQEVDKNLMSPNVLNFKNEKKDKIRDKKFANIKKTIKEYQKFIKNNFKYVGENFAYEARLIHYKDKNKAKGGIYGNASLDQLKELKEEGIETAIVPWVNEKDN